MNDPNFSGLKVLDFAAWMDGGTITLECLTKEGESIKFEFVQNVIIEIHNHEQIQKLPGRLYMNDELVPERSQLEKEILKEMREIVYRKGGIGRMEKACLIEKVEYMESDLFIEHINELEEKKTTPNTHRSNLGGSVGPH